MEHYRYPVLNSLQRHVITFHGSLPRRKFDAMQCNAIFNAIILTAANNPAPSFGLMSVGNL